MTSLQASRYIIRNVISLERSLYNFRLQTTIAFEQETTEDVINAKPFEEIPGDVKIPFLGTTWTYLPFIGKYNHKKLHEASFKKYKIYGPIVRESIGGFYDAVSLFDPKDIEKVFRHEGKFPKRPGIEFLATYRELRPRWYKSGGLSVLEGKEWGEFRVNVQQSLLRPKSIHNYLNPMNRVADDMINRMKRLRNDLMEIPEFLNELYKWSLESLASMALDKRLGCLEDDLKEDSEAMRMIRAAHGTFQGMNDLLFTPMRLWKYIPTKAWKRFVEAQDDFAEIAFKYVKEAMERIENSKDEDREMTFIENLLTTKNIDHRDAITMLLDMLLAGVDTTSHTTSFALYFLAKNSQAQEKAYSEIRNLLSRGQPLTQKVMNELHYVKACIKESMRLFPIVQGTVRSLDHDIVLSGYRIPAGVVFMFQNLVACRQEQYFYQADKFIPERWLEEDKQHHPFLFLPFGFGKRMCIGRRIAEQEMLLLITKIIQNFNIEYNYEDIDCYYRLVNVPDKPLRFRFIDRQ
ncbi:probable cytochrome P450 301a1, mitochondrial [Centruroides sculpturatus]|uniref:probable cytochrome P450 301a1, mitochondrial n=1 Tax=Centruroides sculpturatus TaxID=218467 RepID=UPI000C6D7C22|nr:probable cytochrome P450 301a1, mitochondrial [Centruroides sculpturatus]